jgi:hypothetical protein
VARRISVEILGNMRTRSSARSAGPRAPRRDSTVTSAVPGRGVAAATIGFHGRVLSAVPNSWLPCGCAPSGARSSVR